MRDDEDVPEGVTSVPASWAAEQAEAHGDERYFHETPKADAEIERLNMPPSIQDFPAFGDARSRTSGHLTAIETSYLCLGCSDTGIITSWPDKGTICTECPRCDSDSCLTPDGQRTPIRQQFGLHLCNPHTGARWCNVTCLRASGLDDCFDDINRMALLASVMGEFCTRRTGSPGLQPELSPRFVPLLEELTQYAQAALAGLRPEEGSP